MHSANEAKSFLEANLLKTMQNSATSKMPHYRWAALILKSEGGSFAKCFTHLEGIVQVLEKLLGEGKSTSVEVDNLVLALAKERLQIMRYFRDLARLNRKASTTSFQETSEVPHNTEVQILGIFKAKGRSIKNANVVSDEAVAFAQTLIQPFEGMASSFTTPMMAVSVISDTAKNFPIGSAPKTLINAVKNSSSSSSQVAEIQKLKSDLEQIKVQLSKRPAPSHQQAQVQGGSSSAITAPLSKKQKKAKKKAAKAASGPNAIPLGAPTNVQQPGGPGGAASSGQGGNTLSKEQAEKVRENTKLIRGKLDAHQVGSASLAQAFLKDLKNTFGLSPFLKAFGEGPHEICRNCFAAGKGMTQVHSVGACAKAAGPCFLECTHSLCEGALHWGSACPNTNVLDPKNPKKFEKQQQRANAKKK